MTSTYYQILRDIETQQVLKRSRIQADLSKPICRQSLAQVQLAKRTMQLETFLQDEQIKKQKFIEREVMESMLRRSRLEADIQTNRLQKEAILRRSRLDAQIRTDKVNRHLEKSRLESHIQASRLQSKKVMQDVLRRSKVQSNVNYFLNKL